MKRRNRILMFLLPIFCLVIALGLWAGSEHPAGDWPDWLVKGTTDEDLNKMLFDLGRMRLGIVAEESLNRPGEYLKFDLRQEIRDAGFDPVWKNDKYILRDSNVRKEHDPFQKSRKKTCLTSKIINKENNIEELISVVDITAHMPDELLSDIYNCQLYGFHLVLRDGKFKYVADIGKEDREIKLEELIVLDESVSYNCSWPFRGIEESESSLKKRGFIMRKGTDGYVPVSLEMGAIPEFPPKEVFVHNAIRRINEHVRGYGRRVDDLQRGRIVEPGMGSGPIFSARPHYLESIVLDLYGAETRWNEAEKRYEMVR